MWFPMGEFQLVWQAQSNHAQTQQDRVMRGVSELYFNPDNRIKHPNLTAEHTVELSHGQTLAKLQSLGMQPFWGDS